MFKRLTNILIFLFCISSVYSTDPSLPSVIQFSPLPSSFRHGGIASGHHAFNGAFEVGSFFEMLKRVYQITTVIETGTYQGSTTAFFARVFEEVHTIDNNVHLLNASKENLSSLSNIQFHLGSSEAVLTQLLPDLRDRIVLFYLDAHWESYWPLLDEIEAINRTHHQQCIIVVDDVKVPGRADIPYDSYGDHECSLEYVRGKIEETFDRYTMHYLIPANPAARAKLVFIPS